MESNPWTQDVNWTYMRRLIYVICPRGIKRNIGTNWVHETISTHKKYFLKKIVPKLTHLSPILP